MPRISSFYGISIWLYWSDHQPPHFHAQYAGQHAVIAIDGLVLLRGALPPRAMRLISDWVALHRAELRDDWERAQRREPLVPIEPLP